MTVAGRSFRVVVVSTSRGALQRVLVTVAWTREAGGSVTGGAVGRWWL